MHHINHYSGEHSLGRRHNPGLAKVGCATNVLSKNLKYSSFDKQLQNRFNVNSLQPCISWFKVIALEANSRFIGGMKM